MLCGGGGGGEGATGKIKVVHKTTMIVFGYCDNSVRKKDWRYRKRGAQAREVRKNDLAEGTPFLFTHTL